MIDLVFAWWVKTLMSIPYRDPMGWPHIDDRRPKCPKT